MVIQGDFHVHGAGQVAGHIPLPLRGGAVHQGQLGDQAPDGDGRLDIEGIVGDHGIPAGEQFPGHQGAVGISPHQDGDVRPLRPPGPDLFYGCENRLQLVFREQHFHAAGSLLVQTRLLRHIFVHLLDEGGSHQLVQLPGSLGEEGIVEIHDFPARAVIAVQGRDFRSVELLFQATSQQAPVASPPAVNALLHISHHQGIVTGIDAAVHQGAEIVPLDVRGVLELVQKEIFEADAHLLINERSVRSVDNLMQQGR